MSEFECPYPQCDRKAVWSVEHGRFVYRIQWVCRDHLARFCEEQEGIRIVSFQGTKTFEDGVLMTPWGPALTGPYTKALRSGSVQSS